MTYSTVCDEMITYVTRKIKVGNGNGNFSLINSDKNFKVGNSNGRIGSLLIRITGNYGRGSGISAAEALSLSHSPPP